MLKQSIDYEDAYYIETEWDKWDDLVQDGYECFEDQKAKKGLRFWQDAWNIFLSIMEQDTKTYSCILFENGDAEKAYEIVRKVTWGNSCYMDNSILFIRAKQLADYVGKEDESKWYQQQLDKYEESIEKWEMDDDWLFDEFTLPK